MNIDITKCAKVNVIDSCAIWNLISSALLYAVVTENQFDFAFTKFVEYECLHKLRSRQTSTDDRIQRQLKVEIQKKKFNCYSLTIEDLQDEEVVRNSNKLGMGELSSIAFAKKIGQCFLTDDQKARTVGATLLGKHNVQTTPQIVGWMFYNNLLTSSDLEPLILQHNECERPLEKYLRLVHDEALRLKLLIKS